MKMKRITVLLITLALCLVPAQAQAVTVNSNVQTVALTMTVGESITLSATPATITFTYDGSNAATASGPVTVTTSWQLASGHTSVYESAYFSSTTALTGPSSIPTSQFMQKIDGTGTPSACNVSGNFSTTASCQPIINTTTVTPLTLSGRTDTLLFSLSGVGILGAGSYTGTINIAAQAL
jgi:hypothetical protein